MIKKVLILTVFIAVTLIVSCSTQKMGEITPAAPVFPTATSHFLFVGDSTAGAPPPMPESLLSTPTVANVFSIYPSATPYPYDTPTPRIISIDVETSPTEITTTGAATPTPRLYPVTIYKESLNPNWEVEKSTGMEIYLDSNDEVYHGQTAISFTPLKENAILFFTVTNQSEEIYQRDKLSRIYFWLYSGDDVLRLDQFSIAVVSSNASTYWSADSQPAAALDKKPVLFETREFVPDLNSSIPAHTWAPIELDLAKDYIHDPDFQYITGFYVKTEAGVTRPLAIDDISLEMIGQGPDIMAKALQPTEEVIQKVVNVLIDTKQEVHPISKLIYGVSGAPEEVLLSLRLRLNSWGGKSSTRYNWENGHAWNEGSVNSYRNTNYGITSGSASDEFISQTLDTGAEVRLALPALGWVAKNDDPNTCSFPLPGGMCGDAGGATCQEPGNMKIADPYIANVPSYLSTVISWVQHLLTEKSYDIRFLAIDNEPDLWGFTHYDVHPSCTTYQEILNKYLLYTGILHSYAPNAEFVGPVTSGWYYYWNSAAGEEDKRLHSNIDFIPWFLRQLKMQDEEAGRRSLHVLDIHYYPQNVYNNDVDEKTAALRLRSTRSLWDKTYVDESWINEPVYLIPRMKDLIATNYPGTKLGISEWNWGAERTMNGALAIADVLGIFGREDLYYAAYWQYPPINSPGFFAFKMYTNFDDRGGHFGDTSVIAQSDNVDTLGSYAALDSSTGDLYVMLVNKQADGSTLAQVQLNNYKPGNSAVIYRYDADRPEGIKESTMVLDGGDITLRLPEYSITLMVLHTEKK